MVFTVRNIASPPDDAKVRRRKAKVNSIHNRLQTVHSPFIIHIVQMENLLDFTFNADCFNFMGVSEINKIKCDLKHYLNITINEMKHEIKHESISVR